MECEIFDDKRGSDVVCTKPEAVTFPIDDLFFSGEIVGALNVSQNDLTWLANSKNAQMWLRGVLHFKNLDSITLRFNFDTLPLFKVGLHMHKKKSRIEILA